MPAHDPTDTDQDLDVIRRPDPSADGARPVNADEDPALDGPRTRASSAIPGSRFGPGPADIPPDPSLPARLPVDPGATALLDATSELVLETRSSDTILGYE